MYSEMTALPLAPAGNSLLGYRRFLLLLSHRLCAICLLVMYSSRLAPVCQATRWGLRLRPTYQQSAIYLYALPTSLGVRASLSFAHPSSLTRTAANASPRSPHCAPTPGAGRRAPLHNRPLGRSSHESDQNRFRFDDLALKTSTVSCLG
jgi:hypothetical protein